MLRLAKRYVIREKITQKRHLNAKHSKRARDLVIRMNNVVDRGEEQKNVLLKDKFSDSGRL